MDRVSNITAAEIMRLSKVVASRSRREFHLRRSALLARLWCTMQGLTRGHDYEHIWARSTNRLETIGERALVCRECFKVTDYGPFVGFLPNIVLGSSPLSGRPVPLRRVDDIETELERMEAEFEEVVSGQ